MRHPGGFASTNDNREVNVIRSFLAVVVLCASVSSFAAPPTKSKFYDFGNQIIDGTLKRPGVSLYSEREKPKFARLLRLKKSFLPRLFATNKERVFK